MSSIRLEDYKTNSPKETVNRVIQVVFDLFAKECNGMIRLVRNTIQSLNQNTCQQLINIQDVRSAIRRESDNAVVASIHSIKSLRHSLVNKKKVQLDALIRQIANNPNVKLGDSCELIDEGLLHNAGGSFVLSHRAAYKAFLKVHSVRSIPKINLNHQNHVRKY